MAIHEMPTESLPQEIVENLPKKGTENKIFRKLADDEELREMGITEDYIWCDGEYHPFSFEAKIYGAYFEMYQKSVIETVAEMEQIIAEQAASIAKLEEAVFPQKGK